MKGDHLPEEDYVARYCPPKTIDYDELQASAFLLKRKDGETYLSVNWLEYLGGSSRNEQISRLQDIFAWKLNRVSAGARFATLNVRRTREYIAQGCKICPPLNVIHDPMPDDESHAGLFGIDQPHDELVAELLLEVVASHHAARKPTAA